MSEGEFHESLDRLGHGIVALREENSALKARVAELEADIAAAEKVADDRYIELEKLHSQAATVMGLRDSSLTARLASAERLLRERVCGDEIFTTRDWFRDVKAFLAAGKGEG